MTYTRDAYFHDGIRRPKSKPKAKPTHTIINVTVPDSPAAPKLRRTSKDAAAPAKPIARKPLTQDERRAAMKAERARADERAARMKDRIAAVNSEKR